MKSDSNAPKRLTSLLKRLKSAYKPEQPPASDPVTQMVIGFLQWEATAAQAEQAFTKLMAEMVDINELRVSHDHEVVAVIGDNYPLASQRVARLREALNDIYVREHAVALNSIAAKGKKDQRAYLDSLPGMTPYVSALVTLLSYGGHAMPVDRKLAALLVDEQIIEADADDEQAESFLQRHIKASDAMDAHLLLQVWSDDKAKTSRRRSTSKKTKRTTKSAAGKKKTRTTKRTTASRARKK